MTLLRSFLFEGKFLDTCNKDFLKTRQLIPLNLNYRFLLFTFGNKLETIRICLSSLVAMSSGCQISFTFYNHLNCFILSTKSKLKPYENTEKGRCRRLNYM